VTAVHQKVRLYYKKGRRRRSRRMDAARVIAVMKNISHRLWKSGIVTLSYDSLQDVIQTTTRGQERGHCLLVSH